MVSSARCVELGNAAWPAFMERSRSVEVSDWRWYVDPDSDDPYYTASCLRNDTVYCPSDTDIHTFKFERNGYQLHQVVYEIEQSCLDAYDEKRLPIGRSPIED
eukprot:79793-Karenia_brevis.AAC.1